MGRGEEQCGVCTDDGDLFDGVLFSTRERERVHKADTKRGFGVVVAVVVGREETKQHCTGLLGPARLLR